MAVLSTKARNALPKSKFAGPGRSYPVNDASHAGNAKARATQAVKAGRMSAGQAAAIKAKANAVLARAGRKEDRKKRKEHPVVAAMRLRINGMPVTNGHGSQSSKLDAD
jgi:hypothetical protein